MKERFVKLLLGEDMTGRGKGVSSALALSNAITNLAGNIFFLNFKLNKWDEFDSFMLRILDNLQLLCLENRINLLRSQKIGKEDGEKKLIGSCR